MRGKKAKKLRRAGIKSGPAPRPDLTETQEKKIQKRIDDAKKPYSNSGGMLYGYAEKAKVRAHRDTERRIVKAYDKEMSKKYAEQDAKKTEEIAEGTLKVGDVLHYEMGGTING